MIWVVLFWTAAAGPVAAQHEHHRHETDKTMTEEKQTTDDEQGKIKSVNPMPDSQRSSITDNPVPLISLAELEKLAMANNPTLKQAELAIRAAEGKKLQSGLLPNPVIGFSAEDISLRGNTGEKSGKIGFFIEQKIPLGGKLTKNRRVYEQEINIAEAVNLSQRTRVLNSVRLLYFELLAAQRITELKKELLNLADETVETAGELYNVGLADRPDQIKTEISRRRVEAEYVEAKNKHEELWRQLGAVLGLPELPFARIENNLPDSVVEIDFNSLLTNLLSESPEVKAALAAVEKAGARLRRARAEKIPDLYLRGGIGYNNERIEIAGLGRKTGAEFSFEAGVSVPLFNRNQGGVKTAEAELAIAEREVERLRLVLRSNFAKVLNNYRNAAFLAERYRTVIIPKACAAYEMYAANFESMTAPYTKVLETRAAYLRAQIEYAERLGSAQRSLVLLKSFLLSGGLNSPLENEDLKSEERNLPAGTDDGEDESDQ